MKLRVLLISETREGARILESALENSEYEVIGKTEPGRNLHEEIAKRAADVVIVDVVSPDRELLGQMQALNRERPLPVVVFAQDANSENIEIAVEAGISAYVVAGLERHRVKPILNVAISRFKQLQALRAELQQAQSSLAERKVIERAKGILMHKKHYAERQAYEELRKMAMNSNQRMVEVAEKVVALADLFD